MKKNLIVLIFIFLLTSCFGSPQDEQTDSGALDQTGSTVQTQANQEKIPLPPPQIDTASGGTTTIKPKTSTQDLVNQQGTGGSTQTTSDQVDLNAASEEKMVNEFEGEIEDLLKLLETGN